jgi:serpin B
LRLPSFFFFSATFIPAFPSKSKTLVMLKQNYSVLVLLFVLLSGSCQVHDEEGSGNLVLTEKSAQLVGISNQFGFDLYREIYAWEKEAQNLMVSPLSVSLALAMTYNGAETTTKEAMEKALRLKGLTREEINTSFQSLISGLTSLDPKVLLEIAQSIYYRQNFTVEKNFVEVNRKYYDAEISALDFASPSALGVINGWVNTKTHGKIKEILKEITPSQVMFLLNAIYFKGIWAKEFNKKATEQRTFYPGSGSPVTVPMMNRNDTLDYASNDLFSAIRMPYGSGKFNMFVFLPKGNDVSALVSKLNPESWAAWMKLFKETKDVEISIPRFKYAYEIKLNDVLTTMGMGIAFVPGGADFSGINRGGGLNIDYVKHKTFVEVNEEGTEAAAVTIVAIEKNSIGPSKTYFTVDKPFLYVITEKSSGAILFMGTVKNPLLEQS